MSYLIKQSRYHGEGAKEKATERREERLSATVEATARYADPRAGMSSQQLREQLEAATSKSKKNEACLAY